MKNFFTLLLFFPFVLNAQLVTYDIFPEDLVGLSDDVCNNVHYTNACSGPGAQWGFTWTSTGVEEPLSVTIEFYTGVSCGADLTSDVEINSVVDGTLTGDNTNCACTPSPFVQTINIDPNNYNFNDLNTINVIEENDCAGLSPNGAWGGAYARVTVEYPCTPTEITPDVADIDHMGIIYCGDPYEVTAVPTATNDCGFTFDGTTNDPTTFDEIGVHTITWEYDDGEGNITTQEQTVELVETTPTPIVADLPVLTGECSVEVTENPVAYNKCATSVEEVYEINLGDLFGLTFDCGTGSDYDEVDFGFTWTSTAPADAISSLTLEINGGVNCDGVTDLPFDLNGNDQGVVQAWSWCNCDKTNTFSRTIELDPADYIVGGENEIYITNPGNWIGLSENVDWNDAYARITVNYIEPIEGTTADPLLYDELGDYTVTWTYEDENGNTSTQEQSVSVVDTEAPVVSDCPADITIATNNDNCTAIVTWDEPTAVDNCDDNPTITQSHTSGSVFPLGVTDVIYTFTDEAGNESTCEFTVEVTNDLDVTATSTMTSCNGSSDGSAEATPSGGDPDYAYIWVDESGTTVSTEQELIGVPAGEYEVTVTDQNSCTATTTVMVTEPDEIVIDILSTTNPTDCGVADGEAEIDVNGGTIAGDYTYEWSNTAGVISTDQNPTNLPSGSITIMVTDDNGCTSSNNITLSDPDGPTLTLDGTASLLDLACFGDENGAITLDVTLNGGATSADFDWNDGMFTTQDIADLTVGTYTVVATDDNDCVASASYEVTQPTEITISGEVENASCIGDSDGSVSITVDGGTVAADYDFNWSDGNGFSSTDQNITNLSAATYTVVVTDDNGCEMSASFNVAEPNPISVTPNVTDETEGSDGAISLTVSGGAGKKSYSWTGPDGFTSTQKNISGLVGGIYTVEIVDDCETSNLSVEVKSTVGLRNVSDLSSIKVYPNPSSGVFWIEKPTGLEQLTFEVYDVTGKTVLSNSSDKDKPSVDLSGYEKGVYILKVQSNNTSSTIRLVVN